MTAPPRGRWIALDGLDGAGKGAQLDWLATRLARPGRELIRAREPGGTPQGAELRRLLTTDGAAWTPEAELLLMLADRVEHLAQVVRPALARGAWTLADRCLAAGLAYQGAGRGLGLDRVAALHQAVGADAWPDLLLILDLDPAAALARARARDAAAGAREGRFEAEDDAFFARVRAGFQAIAAADPARRVLIDASGDVATVAARIDAALARALPEA